MIAFLSLVPLRSVFDPGNGSPAFLASVIRLPGNFADRVGDVGVGGIPNPY